MYTSKFFSLCARHDPSWWKCLKPSWRLNCRSRGISFSIAKLAITDLTEITIVIEIFNSSMNVLKAHELANEQANSGRRANARPHGRANEAWTRPSERLSSRRANEPADGRTNKTKVLIEILLPQHKKEVSMTNERTNARPPARGNEPADGRARSDERASRLGGPVDRRPARLARTKLRFPLEILLPQHKREVSMTNERPPARGNEPAKRKNDLIFGNYSLETWFSGTNF